MRARSLLLAVLGLSACYHSIDAQGLADEGSAGSTTTTTTTATTGAASSTGAVAPTTGAGGDASDSGDESTGAALPPDTTTGTGELGPDTDTGTSTGGVDLDECPRLRVLVAPDPSLNVRPTPSTEQEPVASLPHGAIVEVVTAVQGESIEGNTLWYQIAAPAGYVSGVFVECTQDLPPEPPAGFYLPFECGKNVKVTQGNNGDTSHTGTTAYAFDFGLALNTPVHASAPGVVTNIYDLTGPGDPCYGGGGPECGPYGNLVIVRHGDDTATLYKHLNEIHVTIGQEVAQGGVVGLSGTTGYSTGPHLHSMRMNFCGQNNCQSIPMSYVEAGVPVEGQFVTSQNCF